MSLNDSISQGIVDFALLHNIVQGDASTTVPTEGGSVPSIARVIAMIYERVMGSLVATSTTPQTYSTGTKAFTVEANRSFKEGQFLVAANADGGYLFGNVLSYSGTTLVINITSFYGEGTTNDWNISFSGPAGRPGKDGEDTSTPPTANSKLITKFPWEN